jgi:hypothetical protein
MSLGLAKLYLSQNLRIYIYVYVCVPSILAFEIHCGKPTTLGEYQNQPDAQGRNKVRFPLTPNGRFTVSEPGAGKENKKQ